MNYRQMIAPWCFIHRAWHTILRPPPKGSFRILLLHDTPPAFMSAFDTLVDYAMRQHGVLSPEEAEALLNGENLDKASHGKIPVLFSFDDGFASNLEAAAQVLDPRGIRALFFVNCDIIDLDGMDQHKAIAHNIFNGRVTPGSLNAEQHLMTWEELKKLSNKGHIIAAHGRTHRRLSTLKTVDLANEIIESGNRLAEYLNQAVTWYAYAFGAIDDINIRALDCIGKRFRYCRSGIRGINSVATHPHVLLANHINLSDPFAWQRLVIEGGLDICYSVARRKLTKMVSR